MVRNLVLSFFICRVPFFTYWNVSTMVEIKMPSFVWCNLTKHIIVALLYVNSILNSFFYRYEFRDIQL